MTGSSEQLGARGRHDGCDLATPRFSVVIPTYQKASSLERAIDSVLAQTLADFEVLVVDDGSTDSTQAVLAGYRDPRLRAVFREHRGRCSARNHGAARARGRWLVFLDSDDFVEPRWLERFAEALADPSVGIASCGLRVILDDQRTGERARFGQLPADLGPLYDRQAGIFLCGTFAVGRELFDAAGGYEETIAYAENTDLSLRLMAQCRRRGLRLARIPEELLVFEKTRRQLTPETCRERLVSAETILTRHGDTFRRDAPKSYAAYRRIAGTHAARLGEIARARRHFAAAVLGHPTGWRNYPRLLLTALPPLARRVWRPPIAEGS